jgi:hypothetical protein
VDRDTFVFLVSGGHLDMPERLRRGLWPHPPLKLTEVVEIVADCISRSEWFPCSWQPAEEGKPVHEGGTIQQIDPRHFLYRAQRAHPLRPRVLAETVETEFSTAEGAARHFIKWDLHLPGDLDGWKVIDN